MSKTASLFATIAKARKSCLRFQPSLTIPENALKDILDVTLTAPSGFNLQPSQVIILRNQQLKVELANTAMLGPGNMYRTKDSSAIAIFLSDLEPHRRIRRIMELEKKTNMRTKQYLANLPIASTFLMGEGKVATFVKQVATDLMSPIQPMPRIDSVQAWSYKNTSLLAQTFVLAATSHGLATCFMEGYDDRRVKELLRIPDRYGVPIMCCLGYEYEGEDADLSQERTPRLELNEVFFDDIFGKELNLGSSDDARSDSSDKNKTI